VLGEIADTLSTQVVELDVETSITVTQKGNE